ncbi:hypothetical protein Tco_0569776 [Tanacetum coccineum]
MKSLALNAKKNLVMKSVRLPEVKMKNTLWRLETSRSSLREEVDCGGEDDKKVKDETCLVDQASSEAAPKIIMGPPTAMPGSEKSVSFQKSILGPSPKHIIVNNVKVSVASDNEVKQFYKPLSKPGVGFSKPNFRSKTPPPRRVNNNYPRPKTSQPKKKRWSTKSTPWLSCNLEPFPTSKLHAMGNMSSIPTSQPIASNARDF